MRVIVTSGRQPKDKVLALDYKLTTDKGAPLLNTYWSALRAANGKIDTTIILPFIKTSFTFHYRIVTPDSIYTGISHHLRIGHIFAVAGQSNAQGWSPPPYPQPIGDMWVLRNSRFWEYGANPSGLKWNSPWVYMANRFYRFINDSLPIGIVNTAKNGTSLYAPSVEGTWQRNDTLPDDIRTIYGQALRMFRAAGSNFEALFWIQGEADAVSPYGYKPYRSAFKQLVENLDQDLGHHPEFYHLQISGQKLNDGGYEHIAWGHVREAQRELYNSTLVGSAIAYPLSFDGIHYERETIEAVGDRFAAAHAHNKYGVSSALFPALEVDTVLLVPEDPEEPGLGWKAIVHCRQGSDDARLLLNQQLYGFELRQDDTRYDTLQVVANVHPKLAGWIEVRIRNYVILDTSGWSVSYGIRGDPGGANATDTCSASILPNALTAFLDVPAVVGEEPKVPVANVQKKGDKPESQDCRYTIFDLSGRMLAVDPRLPPAEWNTVLPAGLYVYRCDAAGGMSFGKWLIVPR